MAENGIDAALGHLRILAVAAENGFECHSDPDAARFLADDIVRLIDGVFSVVGSTVSVFGDGYAALFDASDFHRIRASVARLAADIDPEGLYT